MKMKMTENCMCSGHMQDKSWTQNARNTLEAQQRLPEDPGVPAAAAVPLDAAVPSAPPAAPPAAVPLTPGTACPAAAAPGVAAQEKEITMPLSGLKKIVILLHFWATKKKMKKNHLETVLVLVRLPETWCWGNFHFLVAAQQPLAPYVPPVICDIKLFDMAELIFSQMHQSS